MTLEAKGWLEALLREAVASWKRDTSSWSALEALALPPGHGRARRYLRGIMRESGLLYGTPAGRVPGDGGAQGREELLFLAVLRTFARVALDVASFAEAAPGPRAEQLLALFAALAGLTAEAGEIVGRVARPQKGPLVPQKLWRTVEEAVGRRAHSLAADPYYGLVLHNGAVYADAQLLGRLSLALFARGELSEQAVSLRQRHAAQLKALLVKVLTGLVCAERPPGFPVRRAITRQIDDLGLPADLAEATLAFVERAFERPPSMRSVLKEVPGPDARRFILEQVLLASLVDGRRSPREQAWTGELAKALRVPASELAAHELQVAEFYAAHRDVVDVFTLSQGAEVMGEEFISAMSVAARKNYRRLLKEVKQTGELSVLLARAARGQVLSAEEKKRMRAQLIDVAKAVPALAIFAAPGGVLLLLALAKVLPFDLLPSAFRDEEEADEGLVPAGGRGREE